MSTPDIAEARTQFDYLLNAYTAAAQADKPAEHDYKVKREALFAYVRETERAARNQAAEVERLRSAVHSCGPTCDKAGCVNARLTQELERLRAQVATVDGHRHIYNGACPDEGNWGSRDPECPACRALGAAPAKQADPARELLLQRIVDGAKPGEGALTASLRAVARDALVQQAPSLTVGERDAPVESEVEALMRTVQTLVMSCYYRRPKDEQDRARANVRAALTAALASHQPAQGLDEQAAFEAWLLSAKFEDCPFKDDPERVKRWGAHYDRYRREGWDARAALAQAPAAEPLTLDEIEAEARKRWYAGDVDNVKFAAGVRFAERAHGIGDAKEQP